MPEYNFLFSVKHFEEIYLKNKANMWLKLLDVAEW